MKGGHSLRYFSGDNGDPREYRRWKQWVQSKIMTMDKLPKAAHGAFIFTLLQGKAMEVVEHLKESEYQKEGGDKVPLDLLDKCWPQKDRADELGEHFSFRLPRTANLSGTGARELGRSSIDAIGRRMCRSPRRLRAG